MKAIVVRPPERGAELTDVPEPGPAPGTLRVRVLECGVCGTDRDIVRGEYGAAPRGRKELILGHENLGEVLEAPEGSGFRPNDLVVATVRRGCGECGFCRSGRSDFCTTGRFTERGIRGADGFLAERYVERPEYLVTVPRSLRAVAVLLEPLSVVEKAFRMAGLVASRKGKATARSGGTGPGRALVTGTGAVGLLGAMLLRVHGFHVSTIDRHGEETRAAAIARGIGATHVDVAGGLTALGPARFDLILEASGSVPLDLELPGLLSPNGTLVLTGIPSTSARYPLLADGRLLRGIVLENQAIVGSVNANRTHFASGLRSLARFRREFRNQLDRLIESRLPWTEFEAALRDPVPGAPKTVLQVDGG